MKLPNKYASHTEQLKVANALPKSLLDHFERQNELTALFRQTLASYFHHISQTAYDSCQVVRFADGALIVATPYLTLANHLNHASKQLIDALRVHRQFDTLITLTIVTTQAN